MHPFWAPLGITLLMFLLVGVVFRGFAWLIYRQERQRQRDIFEAVDRYERSIEQHEGHR